jgi:hypothetical protein
LTVVPFLEPISSMNQRPKLRLSVAWQLDAQGSLQVIVSVLLRVAEIGPSPESTTSATLVSDHRLGGVVGRS